MVEVIPEFEQLEERVEYLKEIGIPEEKIAALIKKVPEVLGCDVATRLAVNVEHIEVRPDVMPAPASREYIASRASHDTVRHDRRVLYR